MLNKLNQEGWCELPQKFITDEDLLALARKIGNVCTHPNGDLIGKLIPKTSNQSNINTFSYHYQFAAFPLHTDTAFWISPARFVLLNNETPSKVATTIIHINDLLDLLTIDEKKILANAIFLVKTSTTNFFTKLVNESANECFFRYDPNCMKAMNTHALSAINILKRKFHEISVKRITWDKPKVLIFDNWKTLHGRESVENNDKRLLNRIYINKI